VGNDISKFSARDAGRYSHTGAHRPSAKPYGSTLSFFPDYAPQRLGSCRAFLLEVAARTRNFRIPNGCRCAAQRARAAATILALPSGDVGPGDRLPWSRQRQAPRLVFMAVAAQRWPRRPWGNNQARQTCLGIQNPQFITPNPLKG
jgi:hypothetical protein